MMSEEPLADAIAAETGLVAPPLAEHARFLRFLITGGIAAIVNVMSRWLLGFLVRYEIAVALAYVVGMTVAFLLARLFVFESDGGSTKGQYVRFALVNLVAFAQVWIVSVGLARYLFPALGFEWQAENIAHAIGVVSPVAMSYIAHRQFSFRKKS